MNTFSKLSSLCAIALLGVTAARGQNVAVNDNGANAYTKAILDISFSNAALPKGWLIPRMPQFPNPIGVAQDGLIIYATAPLAAAAGCPANALGALPANTFWYWDGACWFPMSPGQQPWVITGNPFITPGTAVGQHFLGTTDQMSVAFRTNGGVGPANERMRIREDVGVTTTDGNVGMGDNNPAERLSVGGAILFAGAAASMNATNTAGVIRYNPLVGYHEGNVTGTAGGWKKLENDYLEVFGVTYNQQGPVNCTASSAVIPPWFSGVPPTPGSPAPGPTSASWDVNPFRNTTTATRVRHQWLFRRSELNVELAQLGAPSLNYSVQGICPNVSNINSLDFYVTAVGAAPRSFTGYMLKIRHTPATTLPAAAFDGNPDPAERWVCSTATTALPINSVGWKNFGPLQGPLGASPFVWNGVDNVIVEFCYSTNSALGGATEPSVWCSPMVGYVCNQSREGSLLTAACNNTTLPCGSVAGCGMTTACSVTAPPNAQVRPIVRFNGTSLATAGALTSGATTGKYITFDGGFMVEVAGSNWSLNTPVAGVCARPFRGKGRIAAENGVWDNQIRLNDHVFDRWFDGRVAPQDAAVFGDARTLSIPEMTNYVERERHLPTMKGREEWNKTGGFSLGDLANQLWQTTETHALYTVQLNDRIDALDALSSGGPLTQAEADLVIGMVSTMQGLTEGDKQRITATCQQRVVPAH